ncbi:transposase, partial [Aliiroseovarius halocynthiae]
WTSSVGEAHKHGGSKRRIWRKIHIGIDEETLEVRAVEVTGSNIGDAPVLPDLLDQVPADEEIASVTADGAYDTRKYLGRAIWRRWSGYHRRSRVESKMNCIKLLGQSLMAKDFERQVAELQVRIAVLNRYTALGVPVTEPIE